MGMLFLSIPDHKLSKWRNPRSVEDRHQSAASTKQTTYPVSAPDITMTVPAPASPSNRKSKRTFHFLLTLGSLVLVVLYLLRDERGLLAEHDDKNLTKEISGSPNASTNRTKSYSSDPQPIRQISILGERNSGTRWTYEYVIQSTFLLVF
jgi:hypothetical protein